MSAPQMPAATGTSVLCIVNVCPVGPFASRARQKLMSLDTREKWTPAVLERVAREAVDSLVTGSDSFDIFVRHSSLGNGHHRYLSSFCTTLPPSVSAFLVHKKTTPSVEVEVWLKDDLKSPAHVYKRADTTYPLRRKVECVQVASHNFVDETPTAANSPKVIQPISFKIPLATSQCIRAFRRDLSRQILRTANITSDVASGVGVAFKRESHALTSSRSSKELFEAHVAHCILQGKTIKLQYTLRPPRFASTSSESTVSPSATQEQPALPSQPVKVEVQDTRASTAPEMSSVDTLLASVNAAAPMATAFASSLTAETQRILSQHASQHASHVQAARSLHDGFFDALSSIPVVAAASQASQTPAGTSASTTMPAAGLHGSSHGVEGTFRDAVKDTVNMLQKAMEEVRLNYTATMLDNFGDSAGGPEPAEVSTPRAMPESLPLPKKEEAEKQPEEEKVATSTQVAPASAQEKAVTHNAKCNLCRQRIIGVRWKCTACVDVDVCSSCKVSTPETHPFHSWIKITHNDAVPSDVRPSNWVLHRHIVCDGCDAAIVGPRFKCIVCQDFDWCHDCEADPARHHGPMNGNEAPHLFLKIDKPLRGGRIRSHCERARATSKAVQGVNVSAGNDGEIIVDIDMPAWAARTRVQAPATRCSTEKHNDAICPMPGGFSSSTPSLNAAVAVEEVNGEENKASASASDVTEVADRVSRIEETLLRFEAKMEKILTLAAASQSVAAKAVVTPLEPPVLPRTVADIVRSMKEPAVAPSIATVETTEQDSPAPVSLSDMFQGKQEQHEDNEDLAEYDMKMEADVTVPDDTNFVAGARFDKIWRVRNCGSNVWPQGTQIVAVGESANEPSLSHLPIMLDTRVQPGQTAEVRVNNLLAQDNAGRQTYYFRLALPNTPQHTAGTPSRLFGDQLWCQIKVHDASSASSLSSSAMSSLPVSGRTLPHDLIVADEGEASQNAQLSGDQDQDGLNGSSFFRAPAAPESVYSTAERQTASELQTPSVERDSLMGDEQSDCEDDVVQLGSDDEFEMVEPSDDESEAAAF